MEHSSTEDRNPASKGLDTRAPIEIIKLMHEEDGKALKAVTQALPAIAKAAEAAAQAIKNGGRVFYAGAGTSGRLAVLDAAEIRPTFGSSVFRAVIAGGQSALTEAVEGAEDDRNAGSKAAETIAAGDMAVGISASGKTPFVLGFLEAAGARGASAWILTCSGEPPPVKTHGIISLPTGPELIAGSTRLKAGTATKMALNMLSTTAMVMLGGTHDGLMVDVVPANRKLVERAERIVMEITGCTREEASKALSGSGMKPKTAALMLMLSISGDDAGAELKRVGGSLRNALIERGKDKTG